MFLVYFIIYLPSTYYTKHNMYFLVTNEKESFNRKKPLDMTDSIPYVLPRKAIIYIVPMMGFSQVKDSHGTSIV